MLKSQNFEFRICLMLSSSVPVLTMAIMLLQGADPAWKPSTEPKQVFTANRTTESPTGKAIYPKAPAPTLQEIADEVREADLETVAANLGLELDRHDKHKWRMATTSSASAVLCSWIGWPIKGAGRD
jgi:hypothetical protein